MKRRALSIVTAVVLTGAVIAGATLALLNDSAEQINAFKYDSGTTPPGTRDLAIELKEPFWSDDNDFQFQSDIDAGTKQEPPEGADFYGIKRATDFVAGRMIHKNPTVRNIGRYEAYVGVIVEADSTTSTRLLPELEEYLLDINYDTTEWVEVTSPTADANKRYFIWKGNSTGKLPGLALTSNLDDLTTKPLFTTVTMRPDINNPLGTSGSSTPGKPIDEDDKWDIVVSAFAVQAENEKWEKENGSAWDAETAMVVAFGGAAGTDGSEWFTR